MSRVKPWLGVQGGPPKQNDSQHSSSLFLKSSSADLSDHHRSV